MIQICIVYSNLSCCSRSLGSNDLNGTIPSTFRRLTALNHLFVPNANIIPIVILLRSFSFSGVFENKLRGSIPTWMGELTELRNLCVGFLCQWCNFLKLSSLSRYLGRNLFSGTIPTQLRQLTALRLLWVLSSKACYYFVNQISFQTNAWKFIIWIDSTIASDARQFFNMVRIATPCSRQFMLTSCPDSSVLQERAGESNCLVCFQSGWMVRVWSLASLKDCAGAGLQDINCVCEKRAPSCSAVATQSDNSLATSSIVDVEVTNMTTTTLPAAAMSDDNGALVGGVVGGIFGALVLIGIVVAAIVLLRRRRAPEKHSVDLAPARETSSAYGSLVMVQNHHQQQQQPSIYESGNIEQVGWHASDSLRKRWATTLIFSMN